MFPFLRPDGRKRAADDAAREVLDRTVVLLRRYERAGATALPVADVLEMLGAGTEPAPGSAERLLRDPGDDPMTGCRPAGAP